MTSGGVEDLINMICDMVTDAWSIPLGNDRCVVERDKLLDLLDEIKASLPAELKQARTIVDARNEIMSGAKREAEAIKRQAEERARQMVSQDEVLITAKQKAVDISSAAEAKARDIRKATNMYVDDALRRTEEAVTAALSEIRSSRADFRKTVSSGGSPNLLKGE